MNYFQKANEFYNAKDYKNAIEMYQKSARDFDVKPVCLYNAAVCFIKLQEYSKAMLLLTDAIKLKRRSIYFFNLAYCHAMLKDYKKALIHFNIAWSLDNSDKDCERAINLIMKSKKK